MTTVPTQDDISFEAFSEHYGPVVNQAMSDYLRYNFSDNRSILEEAMQYSLAVGGKRVRPLIMFATTLLFDESVESIMPLASAVEMIHTYSLIHDDLPAMDNDDLRRGKPTSHKKFGEDMAILAGDTLNTFAFELIAKELPHYFDSTKVLMVIEQLANSCGALGMAGGQALDLRGDLSNGSMEDLQTIHRLKTGALLKACVTLPTLLYSDDVDLIESMEKIGEHLGLLFQIVDDILDEISDSETLGKTAHKDSEQGKLTYVSLLGLEQAKRKAKEEYEQTILTLEQVKGYNFDVLKNLIEFIFTRTY